MTGKEYFAKLCLIEAHVHIAKAYNLTGNKYMEIEALKVIKSHIDDIFDQCVSGNQASLYLAGE